jgi:hypothetical protein
VRINEIASAEEQIELWKLVSNSVWQSLQQQERAEQQRKAVTKAKRKVVPKPKDNTKVKSPIFFRAKAQPTKPAQGASLKNQPAASSLTSVTNRNKGVGSNFSSTQPVSRTAVRGNTGFAISNQNQEFPHPTIEPTKPSQDSRQV